MPLSNYVFFLAQLQTFGYLAAYFGVSGYGWVATGGWLRVEDSSLQGWG